MQSESFESFHLPINSVKKLGFWDPSVKYLKEDLIDFNFIALVDLMFTKSKFVLNSLVKCLIYLSTTQHTLSIYKNQIDNATSTPIKFPDYFRNWQFLRYIR